MCIFNCTGKQCKANTMFLVFYEKINKTLTFFLLIIYYKLVEFFSVQITLKIVELKNICIYVFCIFI